MEHLTTLVQEIENKLLPFLDIQSIHHEDPLVIENIPPPWRCLGAGNYAAGLIHPDFYEYVVKVYAPGRPGIEEEAKVYHTIGRHPAYSECFYQGENYLILKRFNGTTLYSCIHQGIPIPRHIINDIDEALKYAKKLGLHPHDVHAKNVMIVEQRGVVVDISDFNNPEYCPLWKDFKKAYYKIYLPYLFKLHPPIPEFVLNSIRKGYRLYKKVKTFFRD